MAAAPQSDIFYAGKLRLGESPCWHAGRQSLWWVDILGQRFFESARAGVAPRILPCDQLIGAVAPARGGGLIAVLHRGIHRLDPVTGQTALLGVPADHDPERLRFNDAKVDARGRLWTGTLALDGGREQARMYRVDHDGTCTVMCERVSISNGLAWSPDGGTLYYIDSPTRTVQAFPFDAEGGRLGPPRVALTFSPEDGWPDGCAVDAEGHLWVAHWGGAQVTCSDPRSGRRVRRAGLPVRHVTSCAFGGPRWDQLFVTTAQGPDPAAAEPEAGFVFQIDPATVGLPLTPFGPP